MFGALEPLPVAIAVATVTAGVLLWFLRLRLLAMCTVVAGGSWLAACYVIDAPSRVLVAVLAATWLPSAALAAGLVVGPRPLALIVGCAIALLAFGLVHAMVYDPFSDRLCTVHCFRRHGIIVSAPDLATWIVRASGLLALFSALVLLTGVLAAIRRDRHRSRALVRLLASLAAAGAAASIALLGVALVALRPTPIPERSPAVTSAAGLALSTCVAAAVALIAADRVMLVRRLRSVTHVVQHGATSAREQLAEALGDPLVRVGYWVADDGYVDDTGEHLGPPTIGRQLTELTGRSERIAVVDHADDVERAVIKRGLGPELRVALDNERLTQQLQRRIADLRTSRRRVVAAADAERGGLERDLHDGAQQRVLALSYELRRGRRLAERRGDQVDADRWAHANGLVLKLLHRLRRVAQGIYPAVIDHRGLGAALESLAASDGRHVQIDLPDGVVTCLPTSVARTAYAVVRDAAPDPPGRTLVGFADGAVQLRFDGCGSLPPTALDRIDAADGYCTARGLAWEVVLPCG